jgi:hypothetical protein
LATVTLRALQRANSEEIKRWIPFTVVVDGKPEFVVERYEQMNPYHVEVKNGADQGTDEGIPAEEKGGEERFTG